MRYRTTTLLARQAMPAAAGTMIIDIPLTDIISRFRFHLEVQRGATLQLTHGFNAVSRIEIVDGSDVLMSLSMAQMDALHFYEKRELGNVYNNEISGFLEHYYTQVEFGRWLHDELLALDPSKFANPQMRITYNQVVYEAGATALFMTVMADVFDEMVPVPIGFFQDREFYRYTPVANAFHYVNLPTDLTLRKMYIQSYSTARAPSDGMAGARLDEDNLKRIPFDMLYNDWAAYLRAEYGECHQIIAGTREGGAFPNYIAPCEHISTMWESVLVAPAMFLIGNNGGQLTLSNGGVETDTYMGHANGVIPYFVLAFPFGYEKDIEDWYDTSRVGSLRLRILNGATIVADTFNAVILQQLRRY